MTPGEKQYIPHTMTVAAAENGREFVLHASGMIIYVGVEGQLTVGDRVVFCSDTSVKIALCDDTPHGLVVGLSVMPLLARVQLVSTAPLLELNPDDNTVHALLGAEAAQAWTDLNAPAPDYDEEKFVGKQLSKVYTSPEQLAADGFASDSPAYREAAATFQQKWKCRGRGCPDRAPIPASSAPTCYTCGRAMELWWCTKS